MEYKFRPRGVCSQEMIIELDEDIISIVFKADGPHNLYLLMNQILSKYAK